MRSGVDDHDVGRPQCHSIQTAQESGANTLLRPPVRGGAGGEDQVVEHDPCARVEEPGEEDIEVAEVPDQDDVGVRGSPEPQTSRCK